MIQKFDQWINESHLLTSRVNIEKWLDGHLIQNYTVNDDLSVDVDGRVLLDGDQTLEQFPVKFNKVSTFFSCTNCRNLTSLKGSPQEVGTNFYCDLCTNLTSLEGSPQKINGSFYCNNCANLTSLEGGPQNVTGDFISVDTIFAKLFENIKYQDFINLSTPEQIKLYVKWIDPKNLSKILTPEESQKYRGYHTWK